MSRSAFPTRAQVEMLLDFLAEKPWLGTGHARTSNARDRTRAAWNEITSKLNSVGGGCEKTWQQWAKYWKDKKAAVKKKVSQIRMARQQTGGGAAQGISCISATEEKIVAIMGGEAFATGDRELEIDPFHLPTNEQAHETVADTPLNALPEEIIRLSVLELPQSRNSTPGSESILQSFVPSFAGELGTTSGQPQSAQSTPTIPDTQPGPSRHENVPIENQESTEQLIPPRAPPSVETNRRNTSIASSSPRRRRILTARRRLLQRSPPSQRQSQMASLTERFIAIEEKRLETEKLLVENQRQMYDIFNKISDAWLQHSQAILDLCTSIRDQTARNPQ